MRLHNIRYGFATNSSSSHSVILAPGLTDTDEPNGLGFGWENFILASPEAKRRYMFVGAKHHYEKSMSTPEAAALARVGFPIPDNYFASAVEDTYGAYIDHQSLRGFPEPRLKRAGMLPLWKFLDKEIVQNNVVAILGGNDNQDNDEWKPTIAKGAPEAAVYAEITGAAGCHYSIDQVSGHLTLFNRDTGKKVRILPEKAGPPQFSIVPELVDIKITDYCPVGCTYCATPGTPINTPTGPKPIETLVVGDVVKAYDLSTGATVEAQVAQVFERNVDEDVIEIELEDGRSLRLTGNHEVFTTNRGWVRADELTDLDDVKII